MSNIKKIKVNYANNIFWLAPKFSSYFRTFSFGYQPYRTLEDLVDKNNLLNFDCYFSFNRLGEKNYDFFNSLYRLRKFKFRLGKDTVYKINKEGQVDDTSINDSLIIRWDKKTLKYIMNGYIPFFSQDWYIKNYIDGKNLEVENKKIIITWSKKEFIELENN